MYNDQLTEFASLKTNNFLVEKLELFKIWSALQKKEKLHYFEETGMDFFHGLLEWFFSA